MKILRAVLVAVLLATLFAPARAQCLWFESDRIATPGGPPFEYLGYPVAVDGDDAVVGAPGDSSSLGGSAWVLHLSGSTWSVATKLTVSVWESGAAFGSAVAISGDRIVVGAPFESAKGFHTGAAYVFQRIGGAWTQVAKLVASNAFRRDYFGGAVAIDGTTALIGAYGALLQATHYNGAAYFFEEQGGAWLETQKVLPVPGGERGLFGRSAVLKGDLAVIGAPFEDQPFVDSGAAYVFTRDVGGWTLSAKLVPEAPEVQAVFGTSVALAGGEVFVGAPHFDDSHTHSGLGSVYVYRWIASAWVESERLQPTDVAADDYFGFSIAARGSRAIVGAHGVDDFGPESGAAYVYELRNGAWSQTAKLHALDAAPGANFGFGAASDVDVVLLTARLAPEPGADPGATYAFDVPSPAQSYGVPCAGASGVAPQLAMFGCPAAGCPLTLRVQGGTPGDDVVVLIGRTQTSIPLASGCSRLVDPVVQTLALPPLGADGASECTLTIPYASSPGWTFTFQAFVGDASAPANQSASNGVEIVLQ